MDIEEALKDVSNYFKQKIISGDFKFKSCRDCIATVVIDDKYTFELWIANNPKFDFGFYSIGFGFTSLDSFNFKTEKERLLGWKQVEPHVDAYKQKVLVREKQKEINRLQKELDKLK